MNLETFDLEMAKNCHVQTWMLSEDDRVFAVVRSGIRHGKKLLHRIENAIAEEFTVLEAKVTNVQVINEGFPYIATLEVNLKNDDGETEIYDINIQSISTY